MNPRRSATVAALCGTIVLAGGSSPGLLLRFGRIENTGAVPIEDRAASLTANAELADAPQATAMGNAAVANTDVATAAESATGMATGKMVASYEPESIVEAALPDPSQMPADLPPVQVATIETKSVDLGHHDVAQPVRQRAIASNPAPVTQDFRYLIYYVWSELPPAEKPADIVLRSLKDTRSERRSRRSSALPTLSVWISVS